MTRAWGGGAWRFAGAVGPGGQVPSLRLPEIAFAGRSNVGKSSLINRLVRMKGLARTSSTPGRTQQINFFVGSEEIVFADLPGYGFAKVPVKIRAQWAGLIEEYLRDRDTLRGVVVIVDARRGVGDLDRELLGFLAELERPVVVALSKIDKLRQAERAKCLRELPAEAAEAIPFSAVTGEGERDLWRRLTALAALR
ncbi:MAG: YihA family ribosome biogenesis GTP-binding protein [Deltaproteobacteria bacterium]|nr:YihA family ribosome biogenesis GTP-binding protein [Deltaproteobacteria bacterium]